jgi:hypothetical protein
MSTLSNSTEITPGQGSFRSLTITVNSIQPVENEGFLLCLLNHSAQFSLCLKSKLFVVLGFTLY